MEDPKKKRLDDLEDRIEELEYEMGIEWEDDEDEDEEE